MTREKVYLSADTSSPSEKVHKITTKGVPLSVDDAEILKMLGKFEVSLSSPIRNKNIRNPTTRKMTSILNENSGFSQVLTICMYMECTRFSIIRWTRNIGARTKVMGRRNFQESIIVSINKRCIFLLSV